MLTDEQIKDEASHHGLIGSTEKLVKFARAIEAEVRKQDEALLQAALDALTCTGESDDPGHRCGHCDDYVDRNGQVRAALRARLEGKP